MKRTLKTTINRSKSAKNDNITRCLDANGNTMTQCTPCVMDIKWKW